MNANDARTARGAHGPLDLRRIVGAVHPREGAVGERLGANGKSVDAGGAPRGRGLATHVVGIGLERDLGAGAEAESFAKAVHEARDAVSA